MHRPAVRVSNRRLCLCRRTTTEQWWWWFVLLFERGGGVLPEELNRRPPPAPSCGRRILESREGKGVSREVCLV
ncbi:hypothetical protein Hanom_Chr00s000002g01601091 [Helianthus anomalus]